MMLRKPMVATGGPSMRGPAMATGGPVMRGDRPMVASSGPVMQGGRPMIGSAGPSMMGNPMMQRPGMQPMGSTFGMPPQLNRTPMGLTAGLGQFANAFANSWKGSTDNPVRPVGYGPQQGMVNSSMPMRGGGAQPQLNMTPIAHPMQGAARVVNAMAQGRQAANGFPARPLNTTSMGGLMQALLPMRRGGGLY